VPVPAHHHESALRARRPIAQRHRRGTWHPSAGIGRPLTRRRITSCPMTRTSTHGRPRAAFRVRRSMSLGRRVPPLILAPLVRATPGPLALSHRDFGPRSSALRTRQARSARAAVAGTALRGGDRYDVAGSPAPDADAGAACDRGTRCEQHPGTKIAFTLGYTSVAAFNAAFRELTGRTPTRYRDSSVRS
jgi:Bacterial regulatory helix-turn-helix proteins, AraC family.